MNVLFVRPRPDPETIGLQHVMLVEPLELEEMAALLPPECTPVLADLILDRRDLRHFLEKYRPRMVCVTGYITNVPEMKRICQEAKRFDPLCVTVAGGVHVEVLPEDLMDAAVDFRVVRNAVSVFPKLVEHALLGRGDVPPGVLSTWEVADPRTLPPHEFSWVRPRRDLNRPYRDRYFYIFHDRVALVKSAFGCPFTCNFCFCRQITGDRFHARPVEDVLDELEEIEQTEIYIVDDDFLVSRARIEAFCDGLERRGIRKRYLVYGRADFIVKNPNLIARFARLGLRTAIVGLESFNAAELAAYDKGTDPHTNEEAIHILHRHGVDCYATLILNPDWSHEDFDFLRRKLVELDIRYVNLQPLTPLPGTGFTVDPSRLLIHRSEYAKWDLAHVMVRPSRMSVHAYYREIIRSYETVLYRPSVLRSHLQYPPAMLWKMIKGTWAVHRQYVQKMREARHA